MASFSRAGGGGGEGMGVGGTSPGGGRIGRGRGRITVEREEEDSSVTARRGVGVGAVGGGPAGGSSSAPGSVVINGTGHGKEKSFFTYDLSAKATDGHESPAGSVTSSASSIAPQLVDPSIGFGIGVNVPDRFMDGKTPVRIVAVDLSQRIGYVVFEDELTIKQRTGLSKKMTDLYGSGAARRLVVPLECVNKNEVYVVKDEGGGAYHRAMVLKTHPQKGAKLVDVDTYEMFIVKNLVAFEMRSEISELWYQVAACKFSLTESLLLKSWMQSNKFVFSNAQMIESTLLSTMEINVGTTFLASDIHKVQENEQDLIRISINIFESIRLKHGFLHSLMFYAIPRLPNDGQIKIAFIANIRDEGYIDVVFCDHLFFELRKLLNDIQVNNQLYSPRCHTMAKFYKEIISGYNSRLFLAPLDSSWGELHRAQILGVEPQPNDKILKILFLDSGKQTTMPLENLCNLALPMNARCAPELLEMVPPQAFTVRIGNMEPSDVQNLLIMRGTFEGMACYVKNASGGGTHKYPLVEIFASSDGEIIPLLDILRFEVSKTGDVVRSSRNTEDGKEKHTEKFRGFRLAPAPLRNFEQQLRDLKQSRKDEIEAQRSRDPESGNRCCCCTKKEEFHPDSQFNVYETLG